MKINGSIPGLRRAVVELVRDADNIHITVSSFPMGLSRDYEKVNPAPPVPTNVVNKVGAKPEVTYNYEDPAWGVAIAEHRQLQTIYNFWRAVNGDTAVVFDNVPTSLDTLRKLSDEIKAAGISDGEVFKVVSVAMELSELGSDRIKDNKASF